MKSIKAKRTVIIKLAVAAFCVAGVIALGFGVIAIMNRNSAKSSPKALLTEHKWYQYSTEMVYPADESDESMGGGYYSGEAKEILYDVSGIVLMTAYHTKEAYGPFYPDITDITFPYYLWEMQYGEGYRWEIGKDNALILNIGEKQIVYHFDQNKETQCNCDISQCKHSDTWYVNGNNLRVGTEGFRAPHNIGELFLIKMQY